MKFTKAVGGSVYLRLLVVLVAASAARGQGPAPETAPPLFPGGGLISYNSIFTTRDMLPGTSSTISPTARPSFSHEADLNFTWGLYKDFDLTVLIPIVTNRFDMAGASALGGTGLGDALLLVKYRFYRKTRSVGLRRRPLRSAPRFGQGEQI